MTDTAQTPEDDAALRLSEFLHRHAKIAVLTGAGCSTQSGIADYRDENGEWKRVQPIQYQDFVSKPSARQRYWARSMLGWRHINDAEPNEAHDALAELEHRGKVQIIITQNVDGLHQRAGSRHVVDLHGKLEEVLCLDCGMTSSRHALQHTLTAQNPRWRYASVNFAPDGDADVIGAEFSEFVVPGCGECGGVLKPAVVFFGENVPRDRVAACYDGVAQANALLVVGSSLMVFSGYRFVRGALERDQPVAILNRGRTRADDTVAMKLNASCGPTLARAVELLR